MANLKDLIVNGAARIIGKLYASEFVGNLNGTASIANKLGTSDIGDTTTPIYLSAGTPATLNYTISKSVPANAVFTDTTYTIDSGDGNGQIKITPSSGSPYNVSVKGLGSRAYDSTSYYPLSGGVLDGHLDIHASNNTVGSYDEGIRIAVGKNGYSTLALGTSTTEPTGTIDGQWWLGCNLGINGRKLYIAHNGSTNSGTYFYADAASTKTPSLMVGGSITTSAVTATNSPIWVQGGSDAGGDVNRMGLTSGMPTGLDYNGKKRGVKIFSNAIALCDPYNGNANNDGGWIRHLETSANNGLLEIAVGDDGDEPIVVRQYNTSSNIVRQANLLDSSGNTSFPGTVSAHAVYGAVWNDLSDSIPVDDDCDLGHGYCYCFDGEKYTKSSKYLDDGIIGIHSDTFGFRMGYEEGKKKMDVAVSGFVLAYVDKEYPPGTPLTCTENGYLTEIKKQDKIEYPEKIVATYWKNETAEEWGTEERKVKVNGRKWVKIK